MLQSQLQRKMKGQDGIYRLVGVLGLHLQRTTASKFSHWRLLIRSLRKSELEALHHEEIQATKTKFEKDISQLRDHAGSRTRNLEAENVQLKLRYSRAITF